MWTHKKVVPILYAFLEINLKVKEIRKVNILQKYLLFHNIIFEAERLISAS